MEAKAYVFAVVTTFVNDKKGGWTAECTATRSDTLERGTGRAEGQSSESNAIQRAVGTATASLHKAIRKEAGKEGQSQ